MSLDYLKVWATREGYHVTRLSESLGN